MKRERANLAAQMDAERTALTRVLDCSTTPWTPGHCARRQNAELRDRRHAAANRLVTLEAALETNRVLPVDDERLLRELDDRIDGLEADLEYVAEARAEAAADGGSVASASPSEPTTNPTNPTNPTTNPTNPTTTRGGDAGPTGLIDKIAGMDGREARTALQVALDKVVELRVQERAGQSRVAELEIQLGDAQSAIEEMESGARMKEMDYDRRVTELQREHSRKEAYLMRLTEAAAATGGDGCRRGYLPRAAHPGLWPRHPRRAGPVVASRAQGAANRGAVHAGRGARGTEPGPQTSGRGSARGARGDGSGGSGFGAATGERRARQQVAQRAGGATLRRAPEGRSRVADEPGAFPGRYGGDGARGVGSGVALSRAPRRGCRSGRICRGRPGVRRPGRGEGRRRWRWRRRGCFRVGIRAPGVARRDGKRRLGWRTRGEGKGQRYL